MTYLDGYFVCLATEHNDRTVPFKQTKFNLSLQEAQLTNDARVCVIHTRSRWGRPRNRINCTVYGRNGAYDSTITDYHLRAYTTRINKVEAKKLITQLRVSS